MLRGVGNVSIAWAIGLVGAGCVSGSGAPAHLQPGGEDDAGGEVETGAVEACEVEGALSCDPASRVRRCVLDSETGALALGPAESCDDGEPCTGDACVEETGCVHPPISCDDADVCNGVETCVAGSGCAAGVPLACSDGLGCTGVETCDAGSGCLPGTPPAGCCGDDLDCDDGDPCNGAGTCKVGTGTCVLSAAPLCNDGNPCNGLEACQPGAGCVSGPVLSCDDGNACNGGEGCDPAKGCVPGIAQLCDDGLPCNGLEACDPKVGCVVGSPLAGCCKSKPDCDDGNPCNGTGSCDAATETCVVAPPPPCADANPCNGVEQCDPAAGCATVASALCASDGNPCNGLESCDESAGCEVAPPQVCSDGNLCNGNESCDPENGCVPGTTIACSDGNPCNGFETCDPEEGCGPGPIPCDDGNPCNGVESCEGTACKPGEPPACDDGDACTEDACPDAGGCTNVPKSCDDGDACTDDACFAASGCSFAAKTCDDGDPCTDDACVEGDCEAAPKPCGDGDPCTDDLCDGGACVHPATDCGDGDLCTEDSCGGAGCANEPVLCDDGDPCTEDCCEGGECEAAFLDCPSEDLCAIGQCDGGECVDVPVSCGDGDPCTLDSCVEGVGCQNLPDGCDDGDACTADGCDPAAGCTNAALDCDDGDPCTSDACDEITGCTHEGACCGLLGVACPEGFACTTSESAKNPSWDFCLRKDPVAGDEVFVPGGVFWMGCDEKTPQDTCQPDEAPSHAVDVPAFVVQRTEVTAARWEVCQAAEGCPDPAIEDDPALCSYDVDANAPKPGLGEHPVNCVDWSMAAGYCSWLASGTGEPWRLPSEAEWEVAARGSCALWSAPEDASCGAAMPVFPWGNDPVTCDLAVTGQGGTGCGTGGTLPVGSKPGGHSVHGALDLAGNVWEWVLDTYHATYDGAPADGRAWIGPEDATRVIRGGSFHVSGSDYGAADRFGYDAAAALNNVGFRCARSLVCPDGLPATVEACNGRDDDCDGTIDESIPSGECPIGVFTWSFDAPAEYVASAGAEVAGGEARLVQVEPLPIDPETAGPALAALWHLDVLSPADVVPAPVATYDFDGELPGEIEGAESGPAPVLVPGLSGDAASLPLRTRLVVDESTLAAGGPFTVAAWVLVAEGRGPVESRVAGRWMQAPALDQGLFATFDASGTGGLETWGYQGAAYDGRHVYFAPYANPTAGLHGFVLRHDTHAPLDEGWSAYDAAGTDGLYTVGHYGASFAGRYVYFFGNDDGGVVHGVVLRYDTEGAFQDPSSWSAFDTALVSGDVTQSYNSAAVVGGALYLVPGIHTAPYDTQFALRLDTSLSMNAISSWQAFDTLTAGPQIGHSGALFDGRFVIYVPGSTTFLRMDAGTTFDLPQAWQSYDPAPSLELGGSQFGGGAFDGRYAVFPPNWTTPKVVRFDTWSGFDDPASWQGYDVSTLSGLTPSRFSGAVFDGRYAWLVPYNDPAGTFVRLDSEGAYEAESSWSAFDAANSVGFDWAYRIGATFDGRYIWIPSKHYGDGGGTETVRIDTTGGLASWSLLSGRGQQGGSNSGGPMGPAAMIETSDGHFVAGVPERLSPHWHHLAMTWDGETLRLHVDGGVAAEAPATGTMSPPSAPFAFGGDGFEGDLDLAGVWDEALPAEAIAALAAPDLRDAGPGAHDAELVDGFAYYAASPALGTSLGLPAGPSGAVVSDAPDLLGPPGFMGGFTAEAWVEVGEERAAPLPVTGRWAWNETLEAEDFEVFDATSLGGGFHGGAFDGRHVYLVPLFGGAEVVRYDTRAPFGEGASWEAFLPPGQLGFEGAAFDGRFLYLAPGEYAGHGNVLRYDTLAPFASESSWVSRDASATSGLDATGFLGGVFDGRHVYFVPHPDAVVLRHDTALDFEDPAAWTAWDAEGTDGLSLFGFATAVFDGRFVTFTPWSGAAQASSPLLRLDTEGDFADPASWSALDLSALLGIPPTHFAGGAFDGRHVYLAPSGIDYVDGPGRYLRYDPTAPFDDPSSWDLFDAKAAFGSPQPWHFGAAFDGRYVVFGAQRVGPDQPGTHGLVTRYDTLGPFDEPASWSEIDPTLGTGSETGGFTGAVFDGRHVTFVPHHIPDLGYHGRVLRYDTAGPGASWRLDASRPDQAAGYAAGPPGPASTLVTDAGTFSAAAPERLEAGWHHLATTFEASEGGGVLRLFVDGLEVAAAEVSGSPAATAAPLHLGGPGAEGAIDEVVLWSEAKGEPHFAGRVAPYAPGPESAEAVLAAAKGVDVEAWTGFSVEVDEPPGTSVGWQLSTDGGKTWRAWSGTKWQAVPDLSLATSSADVALHLGALVPEPPGLRLRAVLATSDASVTPSVSSATVTWLEAP